MNVRIQNAFIFVVAVILFVAAVAKIVTASNAAQALSYPDAVIPLTNRQVFHLVGGLELVVSAFLLTKNGAREIKLCLIAWLAASFLVYRLGLQIQGAPLICDCLGNLNEKLPFSPRTVGLFMLATSIGMLLGSVTFLMLGHLRRRRRIIMTKAAEVNV